MKTLRTTISLLVAIVILAACQSAPESDETYLPKTSGPDFMELLKKSEPGGADYVVPESWTETIEGVNGPVSFTVNIDAPVIIPGRPLSVVKAEPKRLSEEEMNEYPQVFFEDIKYDIESAKLDSNSSIFPEIHVPQGKQLDVLKATAELGENRATLMITQSEDNNSPFISYSYVNESIDYTGYRDYTGEKLKGIKITAQEAENLVRNKLDGLEIDYMELAFIGVSEQYIKQDGDNGEEIFMGPSGNECYILVFNRSINEVLVTYATFEFRPDVNYTDADISAIWPKEQIVAYVNDEGIVSFNWVSKTDLTETINNNVLILPFSEIQDVFKNNVNLIGAIGTEYGKNFISINKIVLGMMRIEVKDKLGVYLYIPVWDFMGPAIDTLDNDYYTEYYSYLTINAIDGSVIDRALGY